MVKYLIIFFSLLLVLSCKTADTEHKTLDDYVDQVPPTVLNSNPADGESYAGLSGSLTVTFSEPVDIETISVNSFSSVCSGTIQISNDNFATCLSHSTSPQPSNEDQVFDFVLSQNLTSTREYKIKINTEVKDVAGLSLSEDYIATFFTTQILSDTGQTSSYTFIFGEDADYTKNPPSFTDNGNGTITDNHTRLIWQKSDNGTGYNWEDAKDYCNNLSLISKSDWRLPNVKELHRILDFGESEPGINTDYFPGTGSGNSYTYYSGTESINDTQMAWYVSFKYGWLTTGDKTETSRARCVRSDFDYSGATQGNYFVDSGDSTIRDQRTGLIWSKYSEETTSQSWLYALTSCENKTLSGESDWRLPNVFELESLVDETRYDPAVNNLYFPDSGSDLYWTSTTYPGDSSGAKLIDFKTGESAWGSKTDYFYFRCVRGGN